MNRLKASFYEGLVKEKKVAIYQDDDLLFRYFYGFTSMDINEMKFVYTKTVNDTYFYDLYYKYKINNQGKIKYGLNLALLFSYVKHDKDIIEKMFQELFSEEKAFLQMKEKTKNNLNEKKLRIEL